MGHRPAVPGPNSPQIRPGSYPPLLWRTAPGVGAISPLREARTLPAAATRGSRCRDARGSRRNAAPAIAGRRRPDMTGRLCDGCQRDSIALVGVRSRPTPRSCRAAPQPRSPSTAGPRAGSRSTVVGPVGPAGRRRRRDGSSRARPPARPGRRLSMRCGHPSAGGSRWHQVERRGQNRPPPGRRPHRSARHGVASHPACRGIRWWQCDRATSAARRVLRNGRTRTMPAGASLAPRPPPRTRTRAFDCNARSALYDGPRAVVQGSSILPPERPGPAPSHRLRSARSSPATPVWAGPSEPGGLPLGGELR